MFRPIAKGGRIQATRLTDRSVADIVKAHAQRAGLDPKLFAGHSLRSGFLTSAVYRNPAWGLSILFITGPNGERMEAAVIIAWCERADPRP